ncbi:PilZ domain-containing protein [Bacteriovorax sp. Seq25_V]|uniref:PilZ domain-containing protein n=1 Tax=Bacteriovorax sp. Seq25_V TaxID=1201288 RepID=UPI00038A1888|nr:PilZ domain-containing protein [Bacteriovorax sp. Seq25_V]EQC44305.1 type IV pilus assembly protein PilZ [Bacteriovorax sp. Seq25_V]
MERHLNLIKTGHQEIEKRIFPRFPFSYLVFRANSNAKSYQVKDISYNGMSIALKDGESTFSEGDSISGEIHWHGVKVEVSMLVRRVSADSIGVEFTGGRSTEIAMKDFLSISNIAKSMKPIHEYKDQMEIPSNLSFWLRCDGPFELFIWKHADGEVSKIQIIMMANFIEWNDGKGLSSGKILSVRNTDTPLTNEEEFEFLIDDKLDEEKLDFAKEIIREINHDLLSKEVYDFICLKLSVS